MELQEILKQGPIRGQRQVTIPTTKKQCSRTKIFSLKRSAALAGPVTSAALWGGESTLKSFAVSKPAPNAALGLKW